MIRATACVLLLAALAMAGCRADDKEAAGPALPEDDPAHGIYNYEHAKAVGIPVDPIPPPDEICPADTVDEGFSAEDMDAPEEQAAIERELATAPSCTADPRGAVIDVGYSVAAVSAASSAFEKGRLICSAEGIGGSLFRAPPALAGGDPYILIRARLARAYGVEPSDDVDELVRGCAATSFGQDFLGG